MLWGPCTLAKEQPEICSLSLLKHHVLSHLELVHKFYFREQIPVVILNLHFPSNLPLLEKPHVAQD